MKFGLSKVIKSADNEMCIKGTDKYIEGDQPW